MWLSPALKVEFERRPGRYKEPNNQSAVKHMDVVLKKVVEWEAGGYLERLDIRVQ
jgi:hypothetical protein